MRRWPRYWTKEDGGEWKPYLPCWNYIESRELAPAPIESTLRLKRLTTIRIHPEEKIEHRPQFILFHALMFDGGVVWDCVNEWREPEMLWDTLATQ